MSFWESYEVFKRKQKESIEGYKHKRVHADDWFDEVSITTVPRYKTSGLSGNEWRQSALVQLKRKGDVIYERRFNKVSTAAAWLSWGLMTVGETEDISHKNDDMYCAQPGCTDLADIFYRIKKLYVPREGIEDSYQPKSYRGFCYRHSERGDQSYEDSDDNYEVLFGKPRTDTEDSDDASPSAYLGAIHLD